MSLLPEIGQQLITQLTEGDNLRDYRHASKLFVADQYRLMPKLGHLFHVFFDINPAAQLPDPENPNRTSEVGMLVKSVSLPKFTMDTKRYNSYNRPNYTQSKVNYDPLTITFHDDSSDVIRNFWFDYYNYYYRDADYSEGLYKTAHRYEPVRPTDRWGYTPRNISGVPYLNAIRIYSLHQKRFSEYVIINPIIKSFRHGDHQQGQSETMQHEMNIEYESVLYYYGSVSASKISGFMDLHYDKSPSPLTPAGGGTRSMLGPGGLLDTASDVAKNLADKNYGSALIKGLGILQRGGSMDLKKAAIGELLGIGTSILRNQNLTSSVFIPTLGIGGALGSGPVMKAGTYEGFYDDSSWLAAGSSEQYVSSYEAGPPNQEMSDATSYADGDYPASEYDDWPTINGDNDVVPGVNTSTSNTSEEQLSDGWGGEPTNQGDMNSPGNKLDVQNRIAKTEESVARHQAELDDLKADQKMVEDAISSLNIKKAALIEGGADPNSFEVRSLQMQIEQQIEISEYNDIIMDAVKKRRDSTQESLAKLTIKGNT